MAYTVKATNLVKDNGKAKGDEGRYYSPGDSLSAKAVEGMNVAALVACNAIEKKATPKKKSES